MVDSTEDLRAVPQGSAFKKFKFNPKVILALVVILIMAIILVKNQNKSPSQIKILAQKDKFKIDFLLLGKDQGNMRTIVEKLELPQSLLKGTEFTLDSTSSAKLAFASPINLDVQSSGDGLSFSGNSQIPLVDANLIPTSGFKIPANTNLAIYGKDFKYLLKKNFTLPPEFTTWVDENLNAKQGQYLTVFGEKNDFSLSFREQKPLDFTKLQEIKTSDLGEPLYKQETDGSINIHLFRVREKQALSSALPQKEEVTFAFFEIGEFAHIASSFDSAKAMLAVQRGESPYLNFPKTEKNVSLVIYARNNQETSPESLSIVATGYENISRYFGKIKEGLLVLNAKKISGYVNL